MKALWLLFLLLPMGAYASPVMTAPRTSHPHSEITLLPGHNEQILNVTRWTAFRISAAFPVVVSERGCHSFRTMQGTYLCDADNDIWIKDARTILDLAGRPNEVRIHWLSTKDHGIPLGDFGPSN